MKVEHSRALRLTEGVTGQTESYLERHLEAGTVVISVDPLVPCVQLAAKVLITTLRRLPGRLVLKREGLPHDLVEDLIEAAEAIDSDRSLSIDEATDSGFSVRVHLGPTAGRGIVRAVPDGYGVHLARDPRATISIRRPANALGAVYTAALAATEVFKHTASVIRARRTLHRYIRYCPVMLSPDLAAAPDLPDIFRVDIALVGLGAIGSGTALILSELKGEGKILLVDKQRYALENRGTYSIGGERASRGRPWKVDVARHVLSSYETIPFRGAVEELVPEVDAGRIHWPRVVLTGLDSVEARHVAQRLWPDHLMDAATGGTALGLHHTRAESGPCLMCFLPPRHSEVTSTGQLSHATGLTIHRLARGDDPLSKEDLEGLTEHQRQRLMPHLGKPICGLADAMGLTTLEAEDYRPAVPFVSLEASCLAVGRLILISSGIAGSPNFVQYDALLGPDNATLEHRTANACCYCQSRANTISKVRHERQVRLSSNR